jgi:hypothetical protein
VCHALHLRRVEDKHLPPSTGASTRANTEDVVKHPGALCTRRRVRGAARRRRTLGTSRSLRESSDAIFVCLPLPRGVRPPVKNKNTGNGGPVRAPIRYVPPPGGGSIDQRPILWTRNEAREPADTAWRPMGQSAIWRAVCPPPRRTCTTPSPTYAPPIARASCRSDGTSSKGGAGTRWTGARGGRTCVLASIALCTGARWCCARA